MIECCKNDCYDDAYVGGLCELHYEEYEESEDRERWALNLLNYRYDDLSQFSNSAQVELKRLQKNFLEASAICRAESTPHQERESRRLMIADSALSLCINLTVDLIGSAVPRQKIERTFPPYWRAYG